MAIIYTDDTHYKNIADAIRAKNGTTTKYMPSDMSAAIEAIKTPSAGTVWAKSNLSYIYDFWCDDNICIGTSWYGDNGSGLYYSTDGMTWIQSNLPDNNAQIYDICYTNDIYVAAGNYGICYSTDAMEWTQSNVTNGHDGVDYANNVWVAYSDSKKRGMYYSSDGMNWYASNITTGGIRELHNIDGLWIARTRSTGLYYSTDGKTWTQSNLTSGSFSDLNKFGDMWILNTDTGIYYSTDGMDWIQSNLQDGIEWYYIYKFKDIYLIYDDYDEVLYYSLNWNDYEARGNNWQKKTVTPSASEQTIYPDSDYVGLSNVFIEPISYTSTENAFDGITIYIGSQGSGSILD